MASEGPCCCAQVEMVVASLGPDTGVVGAAGAARALLPTKQ
jgi:hypothetical protein